MTSIGASERSGEGARPTPEADDCSTEPLRPQVSNADALALIVETFLAADHDKDISRHERTSVMVHLSADGAEAHLHDGPAISGETGRRLACDASICGLLFGNGSEVLDLGRAQRLPNRAQRRALMARDGGCRFPGCTERRYVEAHHVVHWIDGGLTDLANLLLLCWRHHHAVHEGGFRMRFEHGVVAVWRPDGKLLESESLLAEGHDIVEQNEVLRLGITPESVAPQWDGRRLTQEILADTVEGLLWLEDRHERDLAAAIRVPTGESLDGCDPDYPPFIVIDDEDDDDVLAI